MLNCCFIYKKIYFFILLFCISWTNAIAIVYDDVKLVPNPKVINANAFVSNPDGILSLETTDLLNLQLYELEKETSAELAVVVLNTIGTQLIEDFANSLFNHWGIGKSGNDNGVLLLFVLDQKSVRLEIGYGLEGALPDAICKRIQTQVMIPEFKEENYDAGILAGVETIIKIIKKEPVPELSSDNIDWKSFDWKLMLIFIVLFVLLPWLKLFYKSTKIIRSKQYKTNISRYTALKSTKDSAFGSSLFILITLFFFGLFFVFITIFASPMPIMYLLLPVLLSLLIIVLPINMWIKHKMKQVRNAPIPCKSCGGTMYILSGTENIHILSVSQQLEKKLGSIDYDVFKCNKCQKEEIFKLDLSSKKHTICSKCGTKSLILENQVVIQKPTFRHSGMREETYKCLFCNDITKKSVTIPKKQINTSGYSSGGHSSRGSSSSGGSFGGGHSGGGGSTSRW